MYFSFKGEYATSIGSTFYEDDPVTLQNSGEAELVGNHQFFMYMPYELYYYWFTFSADGTITLDINNNERTFDDILEPEMLGTYKKVK